MQENKNSKKKRIEHLRMVLDNPNSEYLHPEDEKYLRLLSKRLKENSGELPISNKKNKSPKNIKTDIDLKPRVTIHVREEKTITKTDFIKPEKELTEKKEEIKLEDEDIIEIEKIETQAPKFIEVKPKEKTVKRKKTKQEKKEIKTDEFMEWETVEEIKGKTKKDKKIKLTKKKKTTTEKEIKGVFIEDIQEENIDETTKINVFKELESIDEKTAVQLYDKGYTSFDELKDITLTELISIGIKRKKAKQIIKEIEDLNKKEEQVPQIEPSNDKLLLTKEKIPEETLKKFEEMEGPVELNNNTHWAPIEEESTPKKKKIKEKIKRIKSKTRKKTNIDVFKELESINEKTAKILLDNNINSVDDLKKKSLEDLKKIKGLKKKIAENIFKEVNKKYMKQEEPVEFIVEDDEIKEKE